MNKEQMKDICDVVIANWNLDRSTSKEFYRTWFRYLGDLDQDAVQAAVDQFVLRDGPPPRAGAVRRLAIDRDSPGLPTAAEAWNELQLIRASVQSGQAWEEGDVSDTLRLTLPHLPDQGMGMSDGFDFGRFKAIYDEETAVLFEERYGIR